MCVPLLKVVVFPAVKSRFGPISQPGSLGVFLNMPAAYLLLHVRKHLRKGCFHASVVVCYKNMDFVGVARQFKAYFLEKVS